MANSFNIGFLQFLLVLLIPILSSCCQINNFSNGWDAGDIFCGDIIILGRGVVLPYLHEKSEINGPRVIEGSVAGANEVLIFLRVEPERDYDIVAICSVNRQRQLQVLH